MTDMRVVYGFHKIPHIEDNAFSKTESQVWEFSNPNFHRDQPDLLCLVTRKKSGETGDRDSLDYQAIMGEIHAIKRHQMTISQDLKRIQADNQALWQEQVDTRARHSKHQETIEKILAFLGSVYGNPRLEDKSIRPKKRKLLLQHDSSDQIQRAESVFTDDRTKETFEDMFKSASTSPNLKPLRQPTTDIASSKINGHTSTENRFTMPNFENRQQAATGPSHPQQIRNMNKMKNSPVTSAVVSPIANLPSIRAADTNPVTPPGAHERGIAGSSVAQLNDSKAMNPSDMQLTSSLQNRIAHNNSKANEIERDLATQDHNIEALASLLGLEPGDLDESLLDESLMADNTLLNQGLMVDTNFNDFDDFLNHNASFAATPSNDLTHDGINGLETPTTKHEMNPPSSRAPTDYNAGGINGPRITSAGSTPRSSSSSVADSVNEEEIEEIDMEKARGRKRKSAG